jgi:hypothetical protein
MGRAPSVALTEPMVPEVEVFGSGRAVIDINDLQETVATSKIINEYRRVFITIAFIPLIMKKPGHPPRPSPFAQIPSPFARMPSPRSVIPNAGF